MAFVRLRPFNGLAIVFSSSILLLSLRAGQYGHFDWQVVKEQHEKVYQAAEIVLSNAQPANIAKFSEVEFKRTYDLLKKRGSDRRDIEAQLGRGQPEPNTNRVRYRSTNGRILEADYSEDGGLLQWQWADERKLKLPPSDRD